MTDKPKEDAPTTWGSSETQFFYELTPDRIIDAVEETGVRCTGRCLALGSLENRVYELEIEEDETDDDHSDSGDKAKVNWRGKNRSDRFRIVKFYRPGRWTKTQILEEHQFLFDLVENEIPVVAPLRFPDGESLKTCSDAEIYFTVFPKVGGRSPDELDSNQLAQVGRLLARLHNVGASRQSEHRVKLSPESYGRENLNSLLTQDLIPLEIRDAYTQIVETICDHVSPWFEAASYQRIHGDCHFGNLLWGDQGPFWVDFDDMVHGPCVQDLWLLVPGRDEVAQGKLSELIAGYEQMRAFDHSTRRLIEPLRALRFVHFSAWIGKRWQDPIFPRYFPHFGTMRYWQEQLQDLRDQWEWISSRQSF